MVLVHGLGGSHVNWWSLGPLLARRCRVYAVDLPGFGRTPPAGRGASVRANTAFVHRFVTAVAGAPAIVVGNSMGGMISLHLAADQPADVAGLVLLDPAVPRAPGSRIDVDVARNFAVALVPGLAERVLSRRRSRVGTLGLVAETLRLCCVDPARVPADLVAASLRFADERGAMPHVDRAFLAAFRSLLNVLRDGRRYRDVIRSVAAPTLLLHGAQDRLVPLAAALETARQRPDWTTVILDDVGHVPQMEVPQLTATHIFDWLDGPGAAAWDAAG